jgi:integrase/recombinase XerD
MTISEAFEVRIVALMAEGKSEKTFKNYRCAMRSLVRAIGDIPVELLSGAQVSLWNYRLKQDGASDTYVQKNYAQLKSVLGYLQDNDMKVMSPRKIKSPSPDTPPKVPLDVAEVQRLIDACRTPRDKAIVALTFTAGARPSEILNLEKDDILETPFDEKGRQKVAVWAKGKKYRFLFINPIARQYINNYLETRRSPMTGNLDRYKPLFMSQQNRQLGLSSVEKIMHRAAADAGLTKRVTPYVLRHSFTTDLLENKAPIEIVSKILGHSSVAITSRVYSHVNTSVQQDVAEKFASPLK